MTDQPTGSIVYGDDIGHYRGGYTSLATTIPATQIRNAGEPVFPELRTILAEIEATKLLPLVNAREAYGINKYGQTLMTGDNRNTATEIMNEALDLLAYATKAMMADKHNPMIADALLASVDVAKMWLELIEDGTFDDAQPVTQAELDRAGEKAKEYRDLLGVELLLPDCVVTKISEEESECQP